MMGNKRLSTIRAELHAAFAAEGSNPIAALDREIRKLKKTPKSGKKKSRSLVLVRDALAQVVDVQPEKRVLRRRSKRAKKAI